MARRVSKFDGRERQTEIAVVTATTEAGPMQLRWVPSRTITANLIYRTTLGGGCIWGLCVHFFVCSTCAMGVHHSNCWLSWTLLMAFCGRAVDFISDISVSVLSRGNTRIRQGRLTFTGWIACEATPQAARVRTETNDVLLNYRFRDKWALTLWIFRRQIIVERLIGKAKKYVLNKWIMEEVTIFILNVLFIVVGLFFFYLLTPFLSVFFPCCEMNRCIIQDSSSLPKQHAYVYIV